MALESRNRGMVLFAALCALALVACSPEPPGPPGSPDASVPADGGEPSTEPGQTHGPKLLLAPAKGLSLGEVAFFGAGVDHPATERKLVLFNVGDAPLRVENFKLESTAADADGLELVLPKDWTGSAIIQPAVGQNFLEVTLRLTPRALGQKHWTLSFESGDPSAPLVNVAVDAQVVTPPPCQFKVSSLTDLDIGLVTVPHAISVATVTNQGTAQVQQCLISDAQLIADPDAPFELAPNKPQVLRAGESGNLDVLLKALPPSLDEHTYEATLQFRVTPPASGLVSVPIRVHSRGGDCLQVAPSDIEFGTAVIACSPSLRYFNLYNTCFAPIYLTTYTVDGAAIPAGAPECTGSADCPQISLVQSPAIPPGGLELAPGGGVAAQFQAKFNPIVEGEASGSVTFSIKQGSTLKTYSASLHGTGVLPSTPITDHHVQPSLPKLDLLFVIDNSPSMTSQQAALASNLSSFLQYLKATPFDFQLAVIKTDPNAGAGFLSGSQDPDKILTPSSTNLDNQFAAKVNVGTSGSGSPECLAQALAALSPPLANGTNSGFLRTNAALEVICITDTTDNSPLAVSDYVTDLQALTAAPSLLTFSAVGGFTTSCPGDSSGRVANAVSLTNGTAADLCASNWHTALENLGYGGFTPTTTFYLTTLPRSSNAITVTVDGVPVAPTNAAGDTVWTYDPAANAVVFAQMYMPAGGQTVDISYTTAEVCYP